MYNIENSDMLSYLEKDEIANFYTCDDIKNAGKNGYGVTKISFFLRSENKYDEYASFIVNWRCDLIVYTNSDDTAFLGEIFEKIKEIYT